MFLTVTLRHFHTPYNTTWPFYGQTLWIHAYSTCNTKSFILWWFFISQKSHPDEEKFQFPAHFRFTKFLKFYFRFSYISSKDAELNFRGSPWGDSLDHSILDLFLILSGEIWQFLAESRHRTWSDGQDDMVNVFCTKISYTPVEIVKLSLWTIFEKLPVIIVFVNAFHGTLCLVSFSLRIAQIFGIFTKIQFDFSSHIWPIM